MDTIERKAELLFLSKTYFNQEPFMFFVAVPKSYFTNREFSFTLKDDVYIRYQSFADQQEMEKEIQKRCPYKIDIGAVFSHKVNMFNLLF